MWRHVESVQHRQSVALLVFLEPIPVVAPYPHEVPEGMHSSSPSTKGGVADLEPQTNGFRAFRAMFDPRQLLVGATVVLTSCAAPSDVSDITAEDTTVAAARKSMVGMSEADVRMCAGFPTMGAAISGTEKIWTYQRAYSRGTVNVGVSSLALGPVPGVTGATATGADGFCNTQVRFVGGKVVQVEFAGDNNTTRAKNALCVSTIDGCVAYAKTGLQLPRPSPSSPSK